METLGDSLEVENFQACLPDYHPQINGWANISINHHPHIIITPILVGGVFGWEHIFYLTITLKSMGRQIFTIIITPILVGGVLGGKLSFI